MRATKNAFKKVVPFQQQTTFNNNPHYQLDLEMSLSASGYPKYKTEEFLLKVLAGAIKTGQVNKDYDILSKYRGRRYTEMVNIVSAANKDLQTKAYSAGQQDVKILQEVLGEGGTFLYSSPCPMVVTCVTSTKDVLAIGDNRFAAKEKLGWKYDITDVIELDLTNTEDFAIYKMISSNSNNHPHQTSMKTKEVTALVYEMVCRDTQLTDMFNPKKGTFDRKKCYEFIKSYKEPITSTALKTVLKNVQIKLSEGSQIRGMFKTMTSDGETLKQATALGTDKRDDIITVEKGMIDRYLYDNIVKLAGTGNKLYLIMRVNVSDFAISVDKLNESRKDAAHNPKILSSAASAIAGFKKVGIKQSYIDNVVILGYWSQHSSESSELLQRVDVNGVVSSVNLDEALNLPSMVI